MCVCVCVCVCVYCSISFVSIHTEQLELRKRQFHLLVHSIHELQRLLEEEETSEESYLESPTLPKEDSGGDSMDVS